MNLSQTWSRAWHHGYKFSATETVVAHGITPKAQEGTTPPDRKGTLLVLWTVLFRVAKAAVWKMCEAFWLWEMSVGVKIIFITMNSGTSPFSCRNISVGKQADLSLILRMLTMDLHQRTVGLWGNQRWKHNFWKSVAVKEHCARCVSVQVRC